MSASRLLLLLLLIAALLTLPAPAARADGVYIPDRAFPAFPAIPSQRAVIAHRDGRQTLIVESALQTDAPAVAWVLPLPAPPDDLHLADPGTLTAAAFSLAPEIRHDYSAAATAGLVLFLYVVPLVLVLYFTRDAKVRWEAFRILLLLEAITVCFWSILLPSLGRAGNAAAVPEATAAVLSVHRLDGADFTVLAAPTPDALNAWLADHALTPLAPDARAIVADYIARGWCFVVGALRPTPGQPHLPRPLVATVNTPAPVFPMKLTALANTTTAVDLYVVARQQAAADGFSCVAADTFNGYPKRRSRTVDGATDAAGYYASDTRMAIASPDLVPLLWNGCVVTHLAARLPPAAMTADIAIRQQPLRPYRAVRYSAQARTEILTAVGLTAAAACALAGGIVCAGGRRPTRAGRRAWTALALAAVIAVTAVPTLPVTPVHTAKGVLAFRNVRPTLLAKAAQRLAAAGRLRPDMPPADYDRLPALLREQLATASVYVPNPFTGLPMRREHSPGNFDLRPLHGRLHLFLYDEATTETDIPLPLPDDPPSPP
jgi:hypothetical protein